MAVSEGHLLLVLDSREEHFVDKPKQMTPALGVSSSDGGNEDIVGNFISLYSLGGALAVKKVVAWNLAPPINITLTLILQILKGFIFICCPVSTLRHLLLNKFLRSIVCEVAILREPSLKDVFFLAYLLWELMSSV